MDKCPLFLLYSLFFNCPFSPPSPPWAPPLRLFSRMQVKVCCTIKLVDYEGLSDGRSLKTMLSHVAPQRLVSRLPPIPNPTSLSD